MSEDYEQAPNINEEGQVAWIAEHADLPADVVAKVLDLEFEFMVGVGIVDLPDYEFRYYTREQLAGSPHVVDTEMLARDAEQVLGIFAEVARQIYDTEQKFLEMRGLSN